VTAEDETRARDYKDEARRQELLASCTDMGAYLRSLGMEGILSAFVPVDVPRIAQLVNKSNQFNLTTHRRTEAEISALCESPSHAAFTVRLADRFGGHGLISVVVAAAEGGVFTIDTWLMSCRVLKRGVEEEVTNEIVRLARTRSCRAVRGVYIPSAKNGMVKDLYPRMGFALLHERDGRLTFELDPATYEPRRTEIHILRRSDESA
jgi:FkbH-like protein